MDLSATTVTPKIGAAPATPAATLRTTVTPCPVLQPMVTPKVALGYPTTADSSYLHLWVEVGADVGVRRPDLLEVMIPP